MLDDGSKSEGMAPDEEGSYDDGAEDEPHVCDGVEVVQGWSGIEGGLQ